MRSGFCCSYTLHRFSCFSCYLFKREKNDFYHSFIPANRFFVFKSFLVWFQVEMDSVQEAVNSSTISRYTWQIYKGNIIFNKKKLVQRNKMATWTFHIDFVRIWCQINTYIICVYVICFGVEAVIKLQWAETEVARDLI